jgi:hypothetical protein
MAETELAWRAIKPLVRGGLLPVDKMLESGQCSVSQSAAAAAAAAE